MSLNKKSDELALHKKHGDTKQRMPCSKPEIQTSWNCKCVTANCSLQFPMKNLMLKVSNIWITKPRSLQIILWWAQEAFFIIQVKIWHFFLFPRSTINYPCSYKSYDIVHVVHVSFKSFESDAISRLLGMSVFWTWWWGHIPARKWTQSFQLKAKSNHILELLSLTNVIWP